MKLGRPKTKKERVEVGGKRDQEISANHETFWVENEKEEGGIIKNDVTYCVEIPGKKICEQCLFRFNCKFSKAERL